MWDILVDKLGPPIWSFVIDRTNLMRLHGTRFSQLSVLEIFIQKCILILLLDVSKPSGHGNTFDRFIDALTNWTNFHKYCEFSNIRRTKSKNSNASQMACSCLRATYWSHVLSGEWRCSWSSADRRCSNYIWLNNNLIAYKGASYIRDLTVYCVFHFYVKITLCIHKSLYFKFRECSVLIFKLSREGTSSILCFMVITLLIFCWIRQIFYYVKGFKLWDWPFHDGLN